MFHCWLFFPSRSFSSLPLRKFMQTSCWTFSIRGNSWCGLWTFYFSFILIISKTLYYDTAVFFFCLFVLFFLLFSFSYKSKCKIRLGVTCWATQPQFCHCCAEFLCSIWLQWEIGVDEELWPLAHVNSTPPSGVKPLLWMHYWF